MFSSLCSQYSLSPSNSTPLIHLNNSASLKTLPVPYSSERPKYPSNFPNNLKWYSSRSNRIRAKKYTDPEGETQFSGENVEVSLKENGGNSSTSFLSILCPLLKLFSGGDPSQERNYIVEEATSSLSSLARLPWGSKSLSASFDTKGISGVLVDPPMRLQLFEFEACPFCRRVREAMTELDISAEIYPCPKGSVRHREMVRKLGGKEQFPFLFDPNTGISMYESSAIVKYLFQKYGEGKSPSFGLLESTVLTGWVPTLLRAGRGMMLWEKAAKELPPRKLELFSYENNPYARVVREALCELELPYILQNVGEGSGRTKLLLESSGVKEVPYIIDPNTGAEIGDYRKILSYLFQTYSTSRGNL